MAHQRPFSSPAIRLGLLFHGDQLPEKALHYRRERVHPLFGLPLPVGRIGAARVIT